MSRAVCAVRGDIRGVRHRARRGWPRLVLALCLAVPAVAHAGAESAGQPGHSAAPAVHTWAVFPRESSLHSPLTRAALLQAPPAEVARSILGPPEVHVVADGLVLQVVARDGGARFAAFLCDASQAAQVAATPIDALRPAAPRDAALLDALHAAWQKRGVRFARPQTAAKPWYAVFRVGAEAATPACTRVAGTETPRAPTSPAASPAELGAQDGASPQETTVRVPWPHAGAGATLTAFVRPRATAVDADAATALAARLRARDVPCQAVWQAPAVGLFCRVSAPAARAALSVLAADSTDGAAAQNEAPPRLAPAQATLVRAARIVRAKRVDVPPAAPVAPDALKRAAQAWARADSVTATAASPERPARAAQRGGRR